MFDRVNRQIIEKVRNGVAGDSFEGGYGFEDVSYPHGGAVVKGNFSVTMEEKEGMMTIEGNVDYTFSDVYTDPVSVRELLQGSSDPELVNEVWRRVTDIGGNLYAITDRWSTRFTAKARRNRDESDFQWSGQ